MHALPACTSWLDGRVFIIASARLYRLSEECLTRPPDEVFDIVSKLGEG